MSPEDHGDLPNGWVWASLGDLVEILRGVTYKKEDAQGQPSPGHVPILRATNIRVHLTFDDLVFVPERYVSSDQYLRQGDIVLAASSGSRNVVGKAAPLDGPWHGSFGAFCFALRPRPGVNPRYLALFLQTSGYRNRISQQAAGVNINNIRAADLSSIPVPLAPAAEQEFIAREAETQLSRLDAAVDNLVHSQANLKRYRAAVLKTACEGRLVPTEAALAQMEERSYEPAESLVERILRSRRAEWNDRCSTRERRNHYPEPSVPTPPETLVIPEGWRLTNLEQITSSIRPICYGILMPKEDLPGGVPYVRVVDMKDGIINLRTIRRTAPEIAKQYARSSLKEGDLLISIRGSYGSVVTVPKELENGNITQDTARLDVSQPVNRDYIRLYLTSPLAQNFFRRVARGVAVKGVNIGDLKLTPILLPPVPEQARIVAETERRLSIVRSIEMAITDNTGRARSLRTSILQRAFTGQLVPQDSNDEPASVLLERIQQEREASAENQFPRRGRRPATKIEKPRSRRAAR